MIKKIAIATCAFVVVAFASCKKDRTCTCTVTKNGTSTTTAQITASITIPGLPLPLPGLGIDTTFSSPVSESQVVDRKMTKLSKRAASQNCISYSEPYSETTYNIVPSFTLTSTNAGTKEYKCELK